MRYAKILPPLLLALGAFTMHPLPSLAQSTSLSWQCQTPAQKPPSGTQCPVNASTPLPVTATQDTGSNLHTVLDSGTLTTLTNPAGVKGADGSTIASPSNPLSTSPTPLATSTAGNAPLACTALCANLTLKGSAGNLYSFEVAADSTLSAAAWWLMVYNATSAPSDGAITPLKCYALPLGTTNVSASWNTIPAYFSTGITLGVSTTGCFNKTAATHAYISGEAK